MPVWPKSVYTFGLGLKTAAVEWKLRRRTAAPAAQAAALAALLPRLAATPHWRAAGIEPGLDYAKFRSRVPLHQPADLAAPIERMRRGEADVLWPGPCALFASSAGTTTGTPRPTPVTEEMLLHFRRAVTDTLLYYTVRVRHAGVFHGRHLLLGGGTELLPAARETSHEAYTTDLSGIIEANLPDWAEHHLYEPGATIAQIPDWEARLEALVTRVVARDITLLAGLPNWALVTALKLLAHAQAAGRPVARLQDLWPNLECFVHTGLSAAPYAGELRQLLGPDVKFQEVYAAAEGFIAAQDTRHATDGLRVMADLGLFLEFLPLAEFDATRLAALGPRAIPLEHVKPDTDYVLLLTTPAGLVRTAIGDIVRFTSTAPHRLLVVGRTDLQLHAFGEHVSEKEVTDVLTSVCAHHEWTITNFHVAPVFAPGLVVGPARGHHEWWLELRAGTTETPKGPLIAEEVDAALQRLNADYAARRRQGTINPPMVRLVIPGVFEHWLRFAGQWGGWNRLPRCRSDRQIARQLAEVTKFADS
jgi:hypothetical protein